MVTLFLLLDWAISQQAHHEHPHSGKFFFGKTPYQTVLDAKHIAYEKNPDMLKSNQKEVYDSIVQLEQSETLEVSVSSNVEFYN